MSLWRQRAGCTSTPEQHGCACTLSMHCHDDGARQSWEQARVCASTHIHTYTEATLKRSVTLQAPVRRHRRTRERRQLHPPAAHTRTWWPLQASLVGFPPSVMPTFLGEKSPGPVCVQVTVSVVAQGSAALSHHMRGLTQRALGLCKAWTLRHSDTECQQREASVAHEDHYPQLRRSTRAQECLP